MLRLLRFSMEYGVDARRQANAFFKSLVDRDAVISKGL